MRHPVICLPEVAEAATRTGEVTVELFAGVETVTLTHADANTGNEITHRTMESVHRITSFLLKNAVRSGGTFLGQLRTSRIFAFCVLFSRYWSGGRNRMGGTTQYCLVFSLKWVRVDPGPARSKRTWILVLSPILHHDAACFLLSAEGIKTIRGM